MTPLTFEDWADTSFPQEDPQVRQKSCSKALRCGSGCRRQQAYLTSPTISPCPIRARDKKNKLSILSLVAAREENMDSMVQFGVDHQQKHPCASDNSTPQNGLGRTNTDA